MPAVDYTVRFSWVLKEGNARCCGIYSVMREKSKAVSVEDKRSENPFLPFFLSHLFFFLRGDYRGAVALKRITNKESCSAARIEAYPILAWVSLT